jgi:periplasmic divalent cation tolerance protein
MNNENEIVVFITAPHEEEASKIAKEIVESRLAACVNIVRNIRSIYRWEGKIEDDTEVLMIVKTQKTQFDALSDKVKQFHSYSVPEIISLPITKGSKEYIQWLKESTTPE